MQAVIVAGGKGTRLRPLTYARPKPMIPLFERPFLAWMVERCRTAGVSDIIINLHYQAEQIRDYFGDGSAFGVRIRYSLEHTPLDTAGAVRQAAPLFSGAPLLVFNADILTDLDLRALIAAHTEAAATATIALTRVEDPTAFGLVECDEHSRVIAFREKPGAEEAQRLGIDTVNAGTYVLDPAVFASIPAETPWSFERQLFPDLLASGTTVLGHVYDSYWLDLGTPQRYWQAHLDILRGAMPFALDAQQSAPQVWIGAGAQVHPDARLEAPCYVGPASHLGADAHLPTGTVVCGPSLVNRPLSAGIYPPGTLLP